MLGRVLAALRSAAGVETVDGRLARSSMRAAVVLLMGTGAGFLVSVTLARVLGPSDFGIYSYAMSIVTLLAVPAAFGLPNYLVREVAGLRATGSWEGVRALVGRSAQLVLSSAAVLSLLAVATGLATRLVEPDERATFLWAFALLPVLSCEQVVAACLRGLSRITESQMPRLVIRPVVFVALLGLGRILDRSLSSHVAMAIQMLSLLVGVALAARWLGRALHRLDRTTPTSSVAPARPSLRQVAVASLPFLGLQIAQVANSQVDIIMLGSLTLAEEVGVYRVALSLAALVAVFLSAGNLVIQPQVARLFGQGEGRQLQQLVTGHARLVAAATLPLACGLVAFGRPLIESVYGEAYGGAYRPLLVLVGAQLVNALAGPVGLVLNMTGNERETTLAYVISIGCGVAISLLLIPQIGLLGAAIASASAVVAWNAILVLRVHTILGVGTTALGVRRP